MCPRSCQRLGHYMEIFQHGVNLKHILILPHYAHSICSIQCRQQHHQGVFRNHACSNLAITMNALVISYTGAVCKVALSTSFCSTPASRAPTTFPVTHILLSVASLTCCNKVACHSHSSRDIESFNMVFNSGSFTKILGDSRMWCQWRAING